MASASLYASGLAPEEPVRKGIAGPRLEIPLESLGQFLCLECHRQLELPGAVLGRMLALTGIVMRQPHLNIACAYPV